MVQYILFIPPFLIWSRRIIDFGSAMDEFTLKHLYGSTGPSRYLLSLWEPLLICHIYVAVPNQVLMMGLYFLLIRAEQTSEYSPPEAFLNATWYHGSTSANLKYVAFLLNDFEC